GAGPPTWAPSRGSRRAPRRSVPTSQRYASAGKRQQSGWCWTVWRRTDALPVDPVGRLHEKRVVGMQPEQVLEVAPDGSLTHVRLEVAASLCPHDEQGRP